MMNTSSPSSLASTNDESSVLVPPDNKNKQPFTRPQLPVPSRSHSYTSSRPFSSCGTNPSLLSKNTRSPSAETSRNAYVALRDSGNTAPPPGDVNPPLGLHDKHDKPTPGTYI